MASSRSSSRALGLDRPWLPSNVSETWCAFRYRSRLFGQCRAFLIAQRNNGVPSIYSEVMYASCGNDDGSAQG